MKVIRQNLSKGGGLHNSCEAAGVSFVTVWTWRKRWKRIDNYINRILESRVQLVEDALYKNALSGQVAAQIFYLKNKGGYKDSPSVVNINKVSVGNGNGKLNGEHKAKQDAMRDFLRERLSL